MGGAERLRRAAGGGRAPAAQSAQPVA